MNTQKGFLDNTVDDGFVVDGTEELNTEMCSYIQNDIEEMCSSMRDDTCGDGMCIVQTSCRPTYRGGTSDGRA